VTVKTYATLIDLRADLVSDGRGVLILRLGDWIWGGGDRWTFSHE